MGIAARPLHERRRAVFHDEGADERNHFSARCRLLRSFPDPRARPSKTKTKNRIDVVCTLEREVGELHKLNLDTRLKRAAQKGDKINVEGDCTTATISG